MKNLLLLTLLSASLSCAAQTGSRPLTKEESKYAPTVITTFDGKEDTDYHKQTKAQVSTRIKVLIKLRFQIQQPGSLPKDKLDATLRVADSLLIEDIKWYNKQASK